MEHSQNSVAKYGHWSLSSLSVDQALAKVDHLVAHECLSKPNVFKPALALEIIPEV
jgi:hypothetical protein